MRSHRSSATALFLTFLLPSFSSSHPLPSDFISPNTPMPHSITDSSLPPPFHYPHHLVMRQMSINDHLELEKRQDDTVGDKLGQIASQLGHVIPVGAIPTSLAATVPFSLPSAPVTNSKSTQVRNVIHNPKVIINPKAGPRPIPTNRFIKARRDISDDADAFGSAAASGARVAATEFTEEAYIVATAAATGAKVVASVVAKEAPIVWGKLKEWAGEGYEEAKEVISKHQHQQQQQRRTALPIRTSLSPSTPTSIPIKVINPKAPHNPKKTGGGALFSASTYIAKLGLNPSTTHPGEPEVTPSPTLYGVVGRGRERGRW